MRAAECVIRFLLGAMLSGAEIFGGYAPFGLGLVAASGSGLDGFCALLGACFGYLSFQGFAEGLCLLRREGLPQELVHAPGGGGDGRHHGLCVLI